MGTDMCGTADGTMVGGRCTNGCVGQRQARMPGLVRAVSAFSDLAIWGTTAT